MDDLLKGIEHKEDNRRKVSDSEVITTAIGSARYFGGPSGQYEGVYEDDQTFTEDVRQKQVLQKVA